jgi:hypothetical protein
MPAVAHASVLESGPFRVLDNGKPAVDDWL